MCANQIYQYAQHLINDEQYNQINDKNKYIRQTDLYTIHHYNNAARSASLKDIEFALRMDNIQEMPFDHTHYVTNDEINEILAYNKNDVEATYNLLLITLGVTKHPVYEGENKIKLRGKFQNLFGLKCDNYPDVKIGAELLLKKYCERTNTNFYEAKKIRGQSEVIALRECIPSWCKIESKEFNQFLDIIKATVVVGNAKEFSYDVIFHGIKINYGLGGEIIAVLIQILILLLLKFDEMKFKKYIDKINKDQILELYNSGLNIKQISEVINVPARRLGEIIKYLDLNIITKNRSKINEDFFDNIDSEIKAYLLGFFVADGCMYKEYKKRNNIVYSIRYRFSLANSIDDLEVIQLFNKYICPYNIIHFYNNQRGVLYKRKEQCILKWCSKHMFDVLEKYGIHQNKTFENEAVISDEIINSQYFNHFLRGLIDGDGHIDKTSIEIVLNSYKFMYQIMNYLTKYNIDSFRTIEIKGKTTNYYHLHITGGKKMFNKIYDLLYLNSNFNLDRKYTEIKRRVNLIDVEHRN